MMIEELIKNIDKVLQMAAREDVREIAEEVNVLFDERMDYIIKGGVFAFKDKLYQIQEYHPLMAAAVKIAENEEF